MPGTGLGALHTALEIYINLEVSCCDSESFCFRYCYEPSGHR